MNNHRGCLAAGNPSSEMIRSVPLKNMKSGCMNKKLFLNSLKESKITEEYFNIISKYHIYNTT